jgi:hypothetical protein
MHELCAGSSPGWTGIDVIPEDDLVLLQPSVFSPICPDAQVVRVRTTTPGGYVEVELPTTSGTEYLHAAAVEGVTQIPIPGDSASRTETARSYREPSPSTSRSSTRPGPPKSRNSLSTRKIAATSPAAGIGMPRRIIILPAALSKSGHHRLATMKLQSPTPTAARFPKSRLLRLPSPAIRCAS